MSNRLKNLLSLEQKINDYEIVEHTHMPVEAIEKLFREYVIN